MGAPSFLLDVWKPEQRSYWKYLELCGSPHCIQVRNLTTSQINVKTLKKIGPLLTNVHFLPLNSMVDETSSLLWWWTKLMIFSNKNGMLIDLTQVDIWNVLVVGLSLLQPLPSPWEEYRGASWTQPKWDNPQRQKWV